nr:hypothetical protein CFP56_13205 [Quercus suber]
MALDEPTVLFVLLRMQRHNRRSSCPVHPGHCSSQRRLRRLEICFALEQSLSMIEFLTARYPPGLSLDPEVRDYYMSVLCSPVSPGTSSGASEHVVSSL